MSRLQVDAPGGKATEPLTSAGSARLGRLGSHRPGSRSGARTLKADSMSASRKSQQSDLAGALLFGEMVADRTSQVAEKGVWRKESK